MAGLFSSSLKAEQKGNADNSSLAGESGLGLSNLPDPRDAEAREVEFSELSQLFSHTRRYDELEPILNRAAALAANYPDDPRFPLLQGGILQARAEWVQASDVLYKGAQRFPLIDDLAYEAILNAADASDYSRAGEMLRQLDARVETLSDRHLRGVWRAANLVGLHDVAQRAHSVALAGQAPGASDKIARRIGAALAIGAALKDSKVRVVSIGENCLPWMVLNRWGLRDDPSDPKWDMIFNLAQSCTDGVAKIIGSSGRTLMDSENIVYVKNPIDTPIPSSPYFQIEYNHEQGWSWINDDYALLKARYRPKIENLDQYAEGPPRLFIHFTDRDGYFDELVKALESFNRDATYRVLIVDVWQSDRQPYKALPETIDYLPLQLPRPDYICFRPDDLDSDEGIAFEKTIVAAVLENLTKLQPSLDLPSLSSI